MPQTIWQLLIICLPGSGLHNPDKATDVCAQQMGSAGWRGSSSPAMFPAITDTDLEQYL